MSDVLAIVIIGVGFLLLVTGISGNYAEPFQLVGITLPGTETAVPVKTAGSSSQTPMTTPAQQQGNSPASLLGGLGQQHLTGV